MPYFTLRIRCEPGEELLYESDFTFHELIPLVRHVTRRLESRVGAEALSGYRAVITPRYGGEPSDEAFPRADTRLPTPEADDGVIQISETDLEREAPVSYFEELEAFYAPGSSSLCVECPERRRCPGSGLVRRPVLLDGWIEIDSEAPRSSRPIEFFTLVVEDRNREHIYEGDYGPGELRLYASTVGQMLRSAGLLERRSSGRQFGEIIVRHDGLPRIDPLFDPEHRPSIRLHFLRPRHSKSELSEVEEPRPLVDWDRLEEERTQVASGSSGEKAEGGRSSSGTGDTEASRAGPEADLDLGIKVLDTEYERLPSRSPPGGRLEAVGDPRGDQLSIYLHHSVHEVLTKAREGLRRERGGILLGGAFQGAEDGRLWVEIVAEAPAVDKDGGPVEMSFDQHFLRRVEEQMGDQEPDRRIVGWYGVHLLGSRRIALYTGRKLYALGIVDSLSLYKDEAFLHRNFFPQPWHVGLVIDGLEDGGMRFYCHQRGELVPCDGFYLVGKTR